MARSVGTLHLADPLAAARAYYRQPVAPLDPLRLSTMTTSSGDIRIIGQGGGSPDTGTNGGVAVISSQVTAGGSGTVTIQGTGGIGRVATEGVNIDGASALATSGASIQISGIEGGGM